MWVQVGSCLEKQIALGLISQTKGNEDCCGL